MNLTKENLTIKMLLKSQQLQLRLSKEWNGDLGWWFLDVLEERFYINPLFLMTLSHKEDEISNYLDLKDLYDMIHPQDLQTLKDQLDLHIQGESMVLELNFRISDPNGLYHQYYINGKIDRESSDCSMPFIIGTAYDVSSQFLTKRQQKKQAKPLHQTQMHDQLTGLLTKDYFENALQHAITLARAGQQSFSLLVLDLDFFKNINEHFGREKGDLVLEEIGRILKKETRISDSIGRTGGDNFQIILADVDVQVGQMICERIRKSIANHMFTSGIRVTISGGFVNFNNHSYEDLQNSAMNLLKKSKANGHDIMSY